MQETARRACVFKWFAGMATQLVGAPAVLQRLLLTMLRGLHRTEECTQSPADVKALAAEVAALLRELAGAPAFIAAHTKAAEELARARGERKRKTAQAALLQPAVAMQRKMKKNLKKRDTRKRKAFESAGYVSKAARFE